MAGLIKGQILKHLSKFTKNLSPDKINISTMKGEGDLNNLELDEVALMEVLDLPTWLRLTKAVCNRVAIKIQWTKLKTQPICIYLDEIVVEMETCSTPREPTSPTTMANLSAQGKYGFAEKIIDGIYMSINSVVVNFKAPAFHASIQMSRILVSSKTALWQNGDLRLTRIKDDLRGEVLIFKEVEWQTLRIEANALESTHLNVTTTPLRLIANQSKTRITIKKKLADCSVVSSRVQFHLDDLLWVLTDSQMKAAFLFVNSLKEVIHRSSLQSKLFAAEKIQRQTSFGVGPGAQKMAPKPTSKAQIAIAKLFAQHDVVETSYHLYTGRIDLHLCDDTAPGHDDEYRPEEEGYRRKVEGGAMQLTLHKLMLDHYPYHPAGTERIHWLKYDENMISRQAWAQDLLSLFREDVRRVREMVLATTPPTSPKLDHVSAQKVQKGQGVGQTHPKSTPAQRLAHQTSITGKSKPTKLLESCVVLRLEDFTLYRVTTANDHKRNSPKKFATSDKKQLLLPPEMSCIHVEYTDYYFPEGIDYPVPSPNLYVVVNPIRLTIDYLTIIWLNAFSLNMLNSLELPQPEGPKYHVDTKIDALMPRIILSAEAEVKGQPERPDGLQIQVSKLSMTNVRNEPKASYSELHHTLKLYQCGRLFKTTEFPVQPDDLLAIPDNFTHHLQRTDHAFINKAVGDIVIGRQAPKKNEDLLSPDSTTEAMPKGLTYYSMSTDSLKLDALKDVWCLAVDQFWVEFIGVPSAKNRPVPFIESFPLTAWIVMPQISSPETAIPHSAQPSSHRSSSSPNGQGNFDSQKNFDCYGSSASQARVDPQERLDSQGHYDSQGNIDPQGQVAPWGHHDPQGYYDQGLTDPLPPQGQFNPQRRPSHPVDRIIDEHYRSDDLNIRRNSRGESPRRDSPPFEGYRSPHREGLPDGLRRTPHSEVPLSDRRTSPQRGPSPHRDSRQRSPHRQSPVRDRESMPRDISPREMHRDSPPRDLYRQSPRRSSPRQDGFYHPRRESPHRVQRQDSGPFRDSPYKEHYRDLRNEQHDNNRPDYGNRGSGNRKMLKQYYSEEVPPQSPGDMHVMVKVGAKINMEINHYQFLFLLRLMESISKFQAELLDDTNYICKQQQIQVKQMVVALVLPECEMALVCPPLPDTSKSLEEQSREDSLDLQEAGLTEQQPPPPEYFNEIEFKEPLPYSNGLNGGSQLSKCHSDTEIASADLEASKAQFQPMSRYASSTLSGQAESLSSFGSQTRDMSMSMQSSSQDVFPLQRITSISTEHMAPRDNRKSAELKKSINNAWSNLSRFSEKVRQNVKKDLLDIDDDDLETVSVRSGDSDDEEFVVLKLQNQTEAPAFERRRNSMSDTDLSNDASNDHDDSFSTASDKPQKLVSVVSFRCRNMEAVMQTRGEDISVAATIDHITPVQYGNINLDKFQAKLAAVPEDSNTLQAHINHSCSIVSLLTKHAGGKEEDISKNESPEVKNPPVKLRYMLGPKAETLAPRGRDLGFLKVLVEDLKLGLGLSSVTSLVDLIEDEVVPEAMPMLIHNKSCYVTLTKMKELNSALVCGNKTPTMEDGENGLGSESDTPPTYKTSPCAVPMDMCVRDLVIWRGQENIFNISCAEEAVPFGKEIHRIRESESQTGIGTYTGAPDSPQVRLSPEQLAAENTQLRQKVADMEEELSKRPKNEWDSKVVKTLEHENDQLRRQLEKIAKLDSHAANEKLQREVEYLREHTSEKLQTENKRLQEHLKKSRDEVQMFKEERESLLTAIRALQDDLEHSERLRDNLERGKKIPRS